MPKNLLRVWLPLISSLVAIRFARSSSPSEITLRKFFRSSTARE